MADYLDLFNQYGQQYGLPSDALRVIAQLESNMNPNAQNPVSSAGGLFQFVDATAPAYGLTGDKRFDPEEATRAAAQLTKDNLRYLTNRLGREPTVGELYLAHQQGMGGAAALLANPGQTAVGALTQVYGDAEKARRAVVQNGGNVNMTAGEFAGLWTNKANKVLNAPVPPGSIPNVVASKLDVTPETRNVPLPRPRPTFASSAPPARLPVIFSPTQGRSDPVGLGASFATVQDMFGGRPNAPRLSPVGMGPTSLATVQDMYGRPGGIGLPPATRSVPSVPFGRVPMPTPANQRPIGFAPPQQIGFPTPVAQRPANPLRVTVQGANSYSGQAPTQQQFVSTTGQALTPRQTVRYNPDTNTFVPVTLYEPQRQERRASMPSGPAQSLV